MSIIILAALAAASTVPTDGSTIGRADWNSVAAAARRMELPASTLYEALTTREAPRRNPRQVRFCVRRNDIVPGKTGMVCRTQAQWTALGIDIAASRS
jgi:hypothetical protein